MRTVDAQSCEGIIANGEPWLGAHSCVIPLSPSRHERPLSPPTPFRSICASLSLPNARVAPQVFDQTVFFSRKGVDEAYLTRHSLHFTMYDMNTLTRHSPIGSYSLDLLRVFYSPQRTIRGAWLGLADTSRPEAGVQGFVRVSIQLVAPGEPLRPMGDDRTGAAVPQGAATDMSTSSALVLRPPSVHQHVHFLVVSLLRAEGLCSNVNGSDHPSASVRVAFNGVAVKTHAIASASPAWCIEFWLPVVLPTCGNLIRLALCDGRSVLAAAVLLFDQVECDIEPEFKWLQMYAPFIGEISKAVSASGGSAPHGVWRGALLLSLRRARNDPGLDLRTKPHVRELEVTGRGGAASSSMEPELDAYLLRAFAFEGSDVPARMKLAVEVVWGGHVWLSEGVQSNSRSMVEWYSELKRAGSKDVKVSSARPNSNGHWLANALA